MNFKDSWDLESAMQVLAHDTVDSEVWAEAVKWLIVHGPPAIRQLLLQASKLAAGASFPGLKPSHYAGDGEPWYNIGDLAKSLGMTEQEVRDLLQEKEAELEFSPFFNTNGNETLH